jgi:hypothetical protein
MVSKRPYFAGDQKATPTPQLLFAPGCRRQVCRRVRIRSPAALPRTRRYSLWGLLPLQPSQLLLLP